MPAPDGAGADASARFMGGAALADGLVTIELGHHVPEAMTPRETRDRARAFPKGERIGPKAERNSERKWGRQRCLRQTAHCPPEHGSQST